MLRGLSAVVGQANITAVVNTGDDMVLHGLHVSPDIDTVTYTLGGASNDETGWGLAGESWAVMDALRAFEVGRRRQPPDLVQPGRPGPCHSPVPHGPAGRRGHLVASDGGSGSALRRASSPAPHDGQQGRDEGHDRPR